jgi:tetratricopeptide (TPR) repeat protein
MRGARPPVAQTVNWSEELQKLDRGAYRAAVVKFASDRVDDDPAHRVWRAEVLCYLDRLEDARAELEAAPIPPELAARAALVEAETLLWEGAPDACEEAALEVAAAVDVADADRARAVALIARADVRRGEYARAVGRIRDARHGVIMAGLAHVAAILDNGEGYARTKAGRDETAIEYLDRAVAAFERMRDPRWTAIALSTRGIWYDDRGRLAEAGADYEQSLRLAGKHGFAREAAIARHNLALTYMSGGDLERAVAVFEEIRDETRGSGNGFAEAHALVSLAFAYLLQGRRREAGRAASSAAELAEISSAALMRAEAEIMLAYLDARDGQASAIARLRHLAATAPTSAQSYRATLYLADAIADLDPDEGADLYRRAQQLADADERSTFAGLAPYVERRLAARPVRVADTGVFVVDVRGRNFPDRRAAHAALDRFLIAAALEAADTQERAGLLLGEAKGNFSRLIKRYGAALAALLAALPPC